MVLGERHLRRVLAEYVASFDEARPHQGLGQRTPTADGGGDPPRRTASKPDRVHGGVTAFAVLGGLHHSSVARRVGATEVGPPDPAGGLDSAREQRQLRSTPPPRRSPG